MSKAPRPWPLFAQVLALVIISLVAAHAISIAVIFSLPPPPAEAYRLSEVAAALRQEGAVAAADAPPLVSRLRNTPPPVRRHGMRVHEFRLQLAQALGAQPEQVVVSVQGRRPMGSRRLRQGLPRSADPVIFAPFQAAVQQADGRWLVAEPKLPFQLGSWQGRILLTLGLSILAVAPLAWLFARRLASPIAAFASAAERLGRDPRAPPLDLGGSGEVAAAAAAFNQMQERLRRYVEDRTAMVGAIAHDLRTPLTRLRFRIEGAPEDLRAKLAADIDQMDAMMSATLAFVRDATRPGERTPLELASLVESIIDETAETGADAAVERTDRVVIEGDPVALRRLVVNLVDNALKYGRQARARVFAEPGQAVIEIDDEGPGVPAQEMDRVFEPFFRGEPSRSRETGGTGLGLAVVRSVARAHGGDAVLRNRPGGGLTARVTLPL